MPTKGTINKVHVQISNKKSQQQQQNQLQSEIDTENVSKLRPSRHGRHSRQSKHSKFPANTEGEDFQIRKALNVYIREELHKQGRKTYFQRVFILAHNIDLEKLEEIDKDSHYSSKAMQQNFRAYFQKHIDRIFAKCDKKKCTNDHLAGLFICMDTYTFLMVEGAEDMMADFFEELSVVHDSLWTESKVFLVEDKIDETYFNCFHTRRSPSININEKFATSTSNDYNLMSVQHFKLIEKLAGTARTFAKELLETANLQQESVKSSISSGDPFTLPADPYNKLLPEIQCIDLVLNAHKFYRSIKDFALTYRHIPDHQDEDALFWPIQNSYTPLAIFERSAFDVNLTFGDYGKEEDLEKTRNSQELLKQ